MLTSLNNVSIITQHRRKKFRTLFASKAWATCVMLWLEISPHKGLKLTMAEFRHIIWRNNSVFPPGWNLPCYRDITPKDKGEKHNISTFFDKNP